MGGAVEGFTIDNGFDWVIDALERCLPRAEERGVLLLLENHWGLTTFAQDMARIIETIDSPWLQAILDMGNFLFEKDMYGRWRASRPMCGWPMPRPIPAAAPGIPSIWTMPASFAFCWRRAGVATCSIEMEGAEAAETAMAQECGDVAAGVGRGR